MKRLRKLLFVLLALFLLYQPALALDISEENKLSTSQEQLQSKSQNSDSSLKNKSNEQKSKNDKLNSSQSNSMELEKELMSPSDLLNEQDNLLDQLMLQFKTLETQVATLEKLSEDSKITIEQLNSQLMSCLKQIENLKANLQNYKEALLSNKEDTGAIIVIVGELQTQVDLLESKLKQTEKKRLNNYIFNTVTSSLLSLSLVATGAIEISLGNERGLDMIKAGGISFTAFHLVYQSGYWLFKWW